MPPYEKVAKDIMISIDHYGVIYEDETVKRALCKFQFILCNVRLKAQMLLVLNREEEGIGWLTLRDLLSVITSSGTVKVNCFNHLAGLKGTAAYIARELMERMPNIECQYLSEHCEQIADIKVKQFFRPLGNDSVSEHTSLTTIARLMCKNNLSCLPVVENKKLVGFIREEDLILEMSTYFFSSVNKITDLEAKIF